MMKEMGLYEYTKGKRGICIRYLICCICYHNVYHFPFFSHTICNWHVQGAFGHHYADSERCCQGRAERQLRQQKQSSRYLSGLHPAHDFHQCHVCIEFASSLQAATAASRTPFLTPSSSLICSLASNLLSVLDNTRQTHWLSI